MATLRSRPWIGTGWKMTKSRAEAVDYADALASAAPGFRHTVNAFVLPSYTLIEPVADILHGTGVQVGAQNVHWADGGAYTGEVSPPMLLDVGATLVSIGHAERRDLFGETDETVRARVAGALRHGLIPIVCVGEPGTERQSGTEVAFVERQIQIALSGLGAESIASTMVAYEPIWAIGAGSTPATPGQADEMHAQIRRILVDLHGASGEDVPLLYGGSVDIASAPDLIAEPHIDGLFVGRAAWRIEGFLELAYIVAGM